MAGRQESGSVADLSTTLEITMAKFLLLHVGFEQPSDEIMAKWGEWFGSIADIQTDQVGFMAGKEISADGVADLGWDRSALTGYNIIEAENMDAALEYAQTCPFITSIRVYELRTSH